MSKARKQKLEKSKEKLIVPGENSIVHDGVTEDGKSQRAISEASFAMMPKKVQYENTYKMDPDARFKSYEIESSAGEILKQHLQDKAYEPEMCRTESQVVAAKISELLKSKNYKRYKHVVIVSIGSIRERPGVYLGSRCLWNDKTDSFCTVRYQNKTLYAIAMIYGLYYE